MASGTAAGTSAVTDRPSAASGDKKPMFFRVYQAPDLDRLEVFLRSHPYSHFRLIRDSKGCLPALKGTSLKARPTRGFSPECVVCSAIDDPAFQRYNAYIPSLATPSWTPTCERSSVRPSCPIGWKAVFDFPRGQGYYCGAQTSAVTHRKQSQ